MKYTFFVLMLCCAFLMRTISMQAADNHDRKTMSRVFNKLYPIQLAAGVEFSTDQEADGNDRITCMTASEKFKKIFTGTRQANVSVWNTDGDILQTIHLRLDRRVQSLAVSDAAQRLAVGTDEHVLSYLLDAEGRVEIDSEKLIKKDPISISFCAHNGIIMSDEFEIVRYNEELCDAKVKISGSYLLSDRDTAEVYVRGLRFGKLLFDEKEDVIFVHANNRGCAGLLKIDGRDTSDASMFPCGSIESFALDEDNLYVDHGMNEPISIYDKHTLRSTGIVRLMHDYCSWDRSSSQVERGEKLRDIAVKILNTTISLSCKKSRLYISSEGGVVIWDTKNKAMLGYAFIKDGAFKGPHVVLDDALFIGLNNGKVQKVDLTYLTDLTSEQIKEIDRSIDPSFDNAHKVALLKKIVQK